MLLHVNFSWKVQTGSGRKLKILEKTGTDCIASSIGGVSGEQNITDLWHDHYKTLLNSNKDVSNKSEVERCMQNISDSHIEKVSFVDVLEAIKKLKGGKSAGIDTLQSEHFKYADSTLSCLFCMVFNAMLGHGYIACELMKTVIVPIIKDKKVLLLTRRTTDP